jgi:drug/metabolite transporter (DMT)-like permease
MFDQVRELPAFSNAALLILKLLLLVAAFIGFCFFAKRKPQRIHYLYIIALFSGAILIIGTLRIASIFNHSVIFGIILLIIISNATAIYTSAALRHRTSKTLLLLCSLSVIIVLGAILFSFRFKPALDVDSVITGVFSGIAANSIYEKWKNR